MRLKKVIQMFERGNVCVCGLRGNGKDMLMANVVARRGKPYVSNLDYGLGNKYQPLEFDKINMNGNTYKDLINGKPKKYVFPYEFGSDIYISDAGVYLPAQYCNELNRDYKGIPMFSALSRQVAGNNTHWNTQSLGRVWDKLREQCDQYIMCRYCYVLPFGIVIQGIRLYDKYESALNRVKPCRVRVPTTMSSEAKQSAKQYLDNFYNVHGEVKNKILIYRNKSNYDTMYFKEVFSNGI